MSTQSYPDRYRELGKGIARFSEVAPGPAAGFASLHKSAITDGELSMRTKELMALAIAIAVRCDGCIAFHVHDALEAGATAGEIAETIGVAVLMGGGPAVVYGTEALTALDQFQADAN